MNERRASVHARRRRSRPFFRNTPDGPDGNSRHTPRQVLAAVREVAVVGEAVPHHVVGGLVALDAERRPREVHRQPQPPYRQSTSSAATSPGAASMRWREAVGLSGSVGMARLGDALTRGPGGPVEERQVRSSTPRRCVRRDTSCRIGYSRSIFRTNAAMSYRRLGHARVRREAGALVRAASISATIWSASARAFRLGTMRAS